MIAFITMALVGFSLDQIRAIFVGIASTGCDITGKFSGDG
jgi:hypothetical protein